MHWSFGGRLPGRQSRSGALIEMIRSQPPNQNLEALFQPGLRLGWEFREPPRMWVDPVLETPPPLVPGRDYRQDLARWEQEYERAMRVSSQAATGSPVWYPAGLERHSDVLLVYGGTAVSWEALLATAGSSLLAEGRRLTLLDISERQSGVALRGLAAAAGYRVREDRIASGATTVDLFAALDADGLIHLALEAAVDDEQLLRAERQQDRMMLREVVGCLGRSPVTLDRMVGGLRVVAGMPPSRDVLTQDEYRALLVLYGRIQSQQGEVVRRANRLAAHLHDLLAFRLIRKVPSSERGRVDLRSITVTAEERLDRQLAADLVVEAVIRRLRRQARSQEREVLFVLGADRMRLDSVDSILHAAERHQILVFLLFEHLQGIGLEVLGWGNSVVAFLQLQNRGEAEAAAGYIGTEERFKLSQSTKTTGQSRERGRGTNTGTSAARSDAFTFGMSFGRTLTTTMTRSEGSSIQDSFGTNASIATTEQVVEELVLKPEQLQSLPHTALAMVDKLSDRRVTLADCNPTVLLSRRVAPVLPPPRTRP